VRTLNRILLAHACAVVLFFAAATCSRAQSSDSASAPTAPASPLTKPSAAQHYGDLPLAFEPNRGQAGDPVQFLSHSTGQLLLLEQNQAVLRVVAKPRAKDGKNPAGQRSDELKIRFANANPTAEILPLDIQPGKSNYFLGNDPAKWRTNVENYSQVRYKSLYPGVDLLFYGNQRMLEHDFIVQPGADYRAIALDISGSRKIRKNADGSVIIEVLSGSGTVRFSAPRIYQVRDGQDIDVSGGYRLKKNELAFNIGSYDKKLPLIIDPVLSYSTYVAGSSTDAAAGIALDSAGNAYITGYTFSTDFPTANAYQAACDSCGNGPDVFVTKLNATGTALVYSTYLGGSNYDQSSSIAVDGAGDAIVTGWTSSTDFPTKNPVETLTNPQPEGFVTSLSPTGSALNFSTYLGGSSGSYGSRVTTDAANNVYVSGQTDSSDFPVTPPTNVIGVPPTYATDALFVAKFTSAGALTFATTIGADPQQQLQGTSVYFPANATAIAVDSNGDVYLAGAASLGLLVTPGAYQSTYTGPQPYCGSCTMGFASELKPDGSALIFSTYLGGSQGDQVTGLALDSSQNLYMTGNTTSMDFPTTPGAFDTTFPSSQPSGQTFVTEMNPTGTALVYSTFLGGPTYAYQTYATGIALDGAGNAVVTGYTASSGFPLLNPLQSTIAPGQYGNGSSTYVTKFNSTGTGLLFSTLFSGSIATQAAGVAINPATPSDIYITGTSYDVDLPTTKGAFQTSVTPPPPYDEIGHAFVTKFDLSVAAPGACPSPASLQFYSEVNKNSPPSVITLTNCGNAPLNVTHLAVTGPFKQTNTCQTAVAPGLSCTVSVVFRGTARGTFTGTLTISDNAPITPLVLQMSGQAVAPVVQFENNPLHVDDQLVGQTGLPAAELIFNQGDYQLQISAVTIDDVADFTVNKKGCNAAVQPQQACVIYVTFHPTVAGPITGTLTFTDNALDSPETVTVMGNGLTAYPVPSTTGVSPNAILQGSPAQAITVFGTGFFQTSRISVQGTQLATTYLGETALSAKVPVGKLKNLGELLVQVVTPAPGGGISNSTPISVYQDLPINANGLVYEPYTQQLYASIGSYATVNPNTIVSIDPVTQAMGTPIAVGGGPNHLGLSSDGTLLYAGLDQADTVQQVKIRSGKLGTSVSLAALSTGYPETASFIDVVPGKPQQYVTSLGTQYGQAGVGLVENGSLVSTLGQYPVQVNVSSLCFLSDPKTFYGSNGQQLLRMVIQEKTYLEVNVDSSAPQGFASQFNCDGKYIYTSSGLVFDPVANQTIGTYMFPQGGSFYDFLPDSAVGLSYGLGYGAGGILVFDQKSFAQVGSIPLPSNITTATALLRWGADGFALLYQNYQTNTNDLVLLRSSQTQPSVGPNPIPVAMSAIPAVKAGNGNFQLTVEGSGFVPGAVVRWNGADRTTIFQSDSVLIADIPASDVAAAGTVAVTVFNPPQGGGTSKKVNYVIAAK
jgi:hypothetical protein